MACSPEQPTGVLVTVEYSRALSALSVSALPSGPRVVPAPFSPRRFELPSAPLDGSTTGSIVILLDPARAGSTLVLALEANESLRRTVTATIVAGALTSTATSFLCGDGLTLAGEGCDDGNNTAGDGCDHRCRVEVVEPPAPPPPPPPPPECGDGALDDGEGCDDGNLVPGDGCDSSCTVELPPPARCGDGSIDSGEGCDDGNLVPGDGCDSTCTVELPHLPTCGDGLVEGSEACDDGGQAALDGCDGGCRIEDGWLCLPGDPSRCFESARTAVVDAAGPSCPGSSGNGTPDDPYCTIVNGIGAGRERVVVYPGEYVGRVIIESSVELLAVSSATISSEVADALTIEDSASVTVQGLTITGRALKPGALTGGGAKVHQGASGVFLECVFGPSAVIGVKSMGGGSFLRVERSHIHHNLGGGVKIDGTGGFVLANNLIVQNGSPTSMIGGVHIMEIGPPATLVNNTIAANSAMLAGGVRCDYPAELINTIIWGNSGAAAPVEDMCLPRFSVLGEASASGSDNLVADPKLDASWHLGQGSPAIDAGDPAGVAPLGPAPADDLDGEPRPQGARVDVGADEAG